ncbi:lysophospholipid acyltransferase family protein [candidate division CSSED10-310 bacterium]|uniref:Lysophospholipid acyltransferase family protein n=1 Tax=candidate division CSSED10-310 bacterium TaxID=2855610 RepID=A0ABV6YVH8_UNCC1
MKKIQYFIEYLFVLPIYKLGAWLPLSFSAAVWRGIALLCYHLFPPASATVRRNIVLTIGRDWEKAKIEDLIRRIFIHMGYFIAEFLKIPRFGDRITEMVHVEGEEHLKAALARGKGAAMVTGHLGNWELYGYASHTAGYRIHVVYRKISNPYINRLIIAHRQLYTAGLPEVKEALKAGEAVFQANDILGLISDQDARHHGIFVDFLGRKASTYVGPAHFVIKHGTQMVLMFFWRERVGKYRLVYETIEPDNSITNEQEQIFDLTKRWVQRLEHYILMNPDQYFWFHRRWKSQPKDEGEAH